MTEPTVTPAFHITEIEPQEISYVPEGKRVHRASHLPHLGTIINDLWYRVMKGYKGEMRDPEAVWESGFVWEELLEHAWATRHGRRIKVLHGVVRPKEGEYDGILMNPDGYKKNPEVGNENHELKFTTKAAKNLLHMDTEFYNWILQSSGYSLMLGCKRTIWWVQVVSNNTALNPTDPWKPARAFKVVRDFLPGELEHNWRVIKQHEKVMRAQGRLK